MMGTTTYRHKYRLSFPARVGIAIVLTLVLFFSRGVASQIQYSLCDIEVLYLFDDAETIDFPTLYYLNEEFGCRIQLLTVKPREVFGYTEKTIKDHRISFHRYYLPDESRKWLDSLFGELFRDRRPDIVMIGNASFTPLYQVVTDYLLALPPSSKRLFNIKKIYRKVVDIDSLSPDEPMVALNGNELFTKYEERIKNEVPLLFPWYDVDHYSPQKLVHYRLVKSLLEKPSTGADFLAGLKLLRLDAIVRSHLSEGPKKQTILKQIDNFTRAFTSALKERGKRRADLIIEGYRSIRPLTQLAPFGKGVDTFPDFQPYVDDFLTQVEHAAWSAVGLAWDGKIFLRDSPHGPKLKYLVSLSANGPKEIEVRAVRFHPYWDTTAVVLDSLTHVILPHQSFVREYLIDVDRSYLEAQRPESLSFTTEIMYGAIPLTFSNTLPVWETPHLRIAFEPDYHIIQPFAKLNVDRVISSMTLRVIISKPKNYTGKAEINLEPPRGLFAGVYRKQLTLDKGSTHETIRIPFSISNLFELGTQYLPITLSVDGKIVAADTARIRIAACKIPETVKVGFLPDTTGALEDLLRMLDVSFHPLTDRALMTADLSAYNVIIIGSGAFRQYPSFPMMKDRFMEYIRQGGSLVLFGQPEDWREGVLPVSFIPVSSLVQKEEIKNLIPEARILSRPYQISSGNLLSFCTTPYHATPAVISPAEKVYVTPSGEALLSVSRLGEGQIIYCGFPLLEMIADLQIDAIHLFANILNY